MKAHETAGSDDRPSLAPKRKPYQKPQMQVYGDLSDITRGNTGSKDRDGAGHPNKHFTS